MLRINIQAFCLDEDTATAVNDLSEERFLIRSAIKVTMGGHTKAMEDLNTGKTPDLIIVETTAKGDALFAELDALANVCEPETRLIIIGVDNDIELFRKLMQMGVSEYLLRPVTTAQLLETIVQIFKSDQTDRSARVIAAISASGGAGSSQMAYCLATELTAAYDSQAIVIDMDLFFGTSALAFNIQPQQTFIEVLTQANRLEMEMLERLLMQYNDRISILASPATLTTSMQISLETVNTLLTLVRQMTDYVIIDLPHRWDPWVQEILVDADEIILVAEPDLINFRDAKNMLEALATIRGKKSQPRLILNKVGKSTKTELSENNFKNTLHLAPDVLIPYDPNLFGSAMNNGDIISNINNKSKVALAIKELAALVSGNTAMVESKRKLFSFLK